MNYKNLSNYQQQQILQKVMRGKSNSSNGVSQNNYDLTGGMKNSNTYGGGNNNNNEYLKTIMQKYQKSGLVGSYSVQKKLQQQHLQQNNHSNGGKSPNILKKSVNAGYSSIEKNKKNISMSGNKKERMASYEGRRLYEEMLERWVKFSNSIFYRTLDKKKKVA